MTINLKIIQLVIRTVKKIKNLKEQDSLVNLLYTINNGYFLDIFLMNLSNINLL